MNPELSSFAARLREAISHQAPAFDPDQFSDWALELFMHQFNHNSVYRRICESRQQTPQTVTAWTQIPAVPAAAFKELELSCIAPANRTVVFHSSGTAEQKPSRHFHCAESLAVYETSLRTWFSTNLPVTRYQLQLLSLTPPPPQAPHSSLVYMFEIIRQQLGQPESAFIGQTDTAGAWTLDCNAALAALTSSPETRHPTLVLGTAFSFVHLLDFLAEKNLSLELPPGSLVMETGGYKNRSRILTKAELHALITERLGVPAENIVSEYGMSELSSQAYSLGAPASCRRVPSPQKHAAKLPTLPAFHFPPWARVQLISPETSREVSDGETGLIRVFDLANVFSVAAIQTEDLGIRRGDGFELVGRAQFAEPRGCSLMSA